MNATKQPIQALSSVYLSLSCSFIWILFSSTGWRHSQTTQGLLQTRMFWYSNYRPAQVSLQYWDPWVKVRISNITHDLINLSFPCYFHLKTLEEMESLVDSSTKAHYRINLWSSPRNPWTIPATWCRGYQKVTSINTWCTCAAASPLSIIVIIYSDGY